MFNVDVDKEGGVVVVTVNTKVYLPDAVFAAAYALTDRAYVYVTGDPAKELFVLLRYKNDKNTEDELKTLGMEFNNYLISFQAYYTQAAYINQLRETIITAATGVVPSPAAVDERPCVPEEAIDSHDVSKETPGDKDLFINDPEGIATPWEEKYGKKDTGEKGEDVDSGSK